MDLSLLRFKSKNIGAETVCFVQMLRELPVLIAFKGALGAIPSPQMRGLLCLPWTGILIWETDLLIWPGATIGIDIARMSLRR